MVRYGRTCPKGFLPIMSVDTLEEAKDLLVATCSRNMDGEFVARELLQKQTLENLYAFGDRLAQAYEEIKARRHSGKAKATWKP